MDKKFRSGGSSVPHVENTKKKRKLVIQGTTMTLKKNSGSAYASQEYEVSKILDRRVVDGKVEYLLLWAGFGLDESTWEEEENLFCTELLEEFNLEEAKKKERSNCAQESTISCNTSDAEDEITIDALPPELKREIFKRIESKTDLRLVCSQWKNQVDSWFYNHNGILTDDSVSLIRNSNLQFDTITVQNLHKDLSSENIKTTRSHTRSGLALNPRKLVFTNVNDSRRSSTSVSYENIELLMRLNTEIKSLVFNRCMLPHTKLTLDGLYFPNLTELEIKLNHISIASNQKTAFHYISKLKLPSLTTMEINVEESADEYNQLYIGIYELIASFKKSLKNLDVSFNSYFNGNVNKTLPLEASHLALLRKNLSQIHLESLCISLDNFEEPECKNLALSLLLSQHTLKYLEIRFYVASFQIVAPMVKRIMEQNSSSLVNLTFRHCEFTNRFDEILDANEASRLRSMFEPLVSVSASQAKLESLSVYGFQLTLAPTDSSTFVDLSSLPPSIKSLKLGGHLDQSIFHALASNANGNRTPCLPFLEELVIFNTDQNREKYSMSKVYLNKILNLLPKLKLFKINYCSVDNFDLMHFQSTNQSVKIEKAHMSCDSWHPMQRLPRYIFYFVVNEV